MTYKLYLYNDNEDIIGKYTTKGDDMEKVYQTFGARIIRQGFKSGMSIPQQIITYQEYIKVINKQKENCEKIRASDLLMYLSCYCALYKFKTIEGDHMFLKIKKKKSASPQSHPTSPQPLP